MPTAAAISALFLLLLPAVPPSTAGNGGPSAAQTPDFQVAVFPGSVNVSVGGTAQVTAIVSAVDGYAGPPVAIYLQSPPSNLTAGCDPSPIPPTAACTLHLFAGDQATPGQYSVTVAGTNGTAVRTAVLSVNVTPRSIPGDFTISGPAGPVTVRAGETASTTITVAFQGGFSGTVLLTASGLPANVGYRFNPVSLATSGTSELSFTASSDAAGGTFGLLVKGISGALERGVSVTLQVAGPEYRIVVGSVPSGLQVEVDGGNVTTPYTLTCAPGSGHTVSAAEEQTRDTVAYRFSSWSDGLDRTHNITCDASGSVAALYASIPVSVSAGISLPLAAGIAFAALVAGWLLGWALLRRRRAPGPEATAPPAPAARVEAPKPPSRLSVAEKLSLLEQRRSRGEVSEPLYRELKGKFESEGRAGQKVG